MRFTREGWPEKKDADDPAQKFRKPADTLSVCHGCLLYGSRVVIPTKLRRQVLDLLHECHFGIQRMKQLARTAVYWPNIDSDILDLCRQCPICAGHQSEPPKAAVHPWMLPEKPRSRLHIDHAMSFLGYNWLVVTDAYTKYPCSQYQRSQRSSSCKRISRISVSPIQVQLTVLLPSNQRTSRNSAKRMEFIHLTGAPYNPATNGAAERLVQTFKLALKKSTKAPKDALQDFPKAFAATPLLLPVTRQANYWTDVKSVLKLTRYYLRLPTLPRASKRKKLLSPSSLSGNFS